MIKFKFNEKIVNYLLIFILGFLVGVAVKTEAQKRVTIGFNDYLIPKYKEDFNPMTLPQNTTPSTNGTEIPEGEEPQPEPQNEQDNAQ